MHLGLDECSTSRKAEMLRVERRAEGKAKEMMEGEGRENRREGGRKNFFRGYLKRGRHGGNGDMG